MFPNYSSHKYWLVISGNATLNYIIPCYASRILESRYVDQQINKYTTFCMINVMVKVKVGTKEEDITQYFRGFFPQKK